MDDGRQKVNSPQRRRGRRDYFMDMYRLSSVVRRLSSVVRLIALMLHQCYAIANSKLRSRWVDARRGDTCGGDAVAA